MGIGTGLATCHPGCPRARRHAAGSPQEVAVSLAVASVLSARSSGVLLHPTSLPSPYGIGELGPVAYAWVNALARAGQTWWQILPLGPTGFGDSPYQAYS